KSRCCGPVKHVNAGVTNLYKLFSVCYFSGSLMGDSVVMVSLYPEFPQSVTSSVASCGEFVLLMDRSGSMSNSRISSARDTLLLLLKSLPMGCYFNIYSFGSRYEHIFPKSVEYSQQTMEEALKTVVQMEANLGGTEMLQPLKHIYSQPCIPNQPRQLFVFTDGEVWDTKEVIDLVKRNSDSHRCFSFGIGEGASSALINGMAKEGGGHAQFITDTDRMQAKVMQSLRFALQPAVVDISVTWDLPKEVSVTVLSPPITALFPGQRSLIYAQLSGQSSEAAEGCVTVKYSLAGHPSENQLHFSLRPAEDTGLTVHKLGARTLIRSLEEGEHRGWQDTKVKEKVVQLSVQSGISSSLTAFIAVFNNNGEAIQGPLLHKNILKHGVPGMSHREEAPGQTQDTLERLYLSAAGGGGWGEGGLASVSEQQTRDPLLQLVSLQEATGKWLLDPALPTALGKTNEEVEKSKPVLANKEIWATILALIWLHGLKMDSKNEWDLLAMKAASWLRAQNAPWVTECVEAANLLLGCSVMKEALGL
uniref:VWFA domain-containing protein n=1 Tax=Haplochromis burtoni TaxID=8153 RepID=A0A3Q2W1S2_HAPBU